MPVSTIIFWRQIFDEKQPRSIWQHLRHLLSLLVQLALLLLLVLALAEPFFTWEVLQARRLVLVVDNSASMNATDVDPTRLDEAKDVAREAASRLRFRDEMAIVAAGTTPQVVCGLTGHERTLHGAIDAVQPTDGPTHMTEALALARRLLGDAENGRVIVVSDGCFEEADELAAAEDVELHLVGTRTANVGITNFQVRRSLLDPIGYEILVEVANQSDEAVECRLEVDLNDSPVDVIPLKLEPGQVWSQILEKTSADGGTLLARINHDDALAATTLRLALLPKRKSKRLSSSRRATTFCRKSLRPTRSCSCPSSPNLQARLTPAQLSFSTATYRRSYPPAACWSWTPPAAPTFGRSATSSPTRSSPSKMPTRRSCGTCGSITCSCPKHASLRSPNQAEIW